MAEKPVNNSQKDFKPLHELKIPTMKDGVMKDIPALHPSWAEFRQFLFYKEPPEPGPDSSFPIGAKEAWLERMEILNTDLMWMLKLEHHRFWSQIICNESTLGLILWFLQDATPYYILEEFPQDEEMWNSFQKTHYLVFLVVNRLATIKESDEHFVSPKHLGALLYDNFVFTLPMMFDICMCYGRENRAQVQNIINTIFEVQPKYEDDLKTCITLIGKAFRSVEYRFGGRKLPEGELVKLCERPDQGKEMTLFDLKDLVLYMLDTAANLSLFLDIYSPGCSMFHQQLFELKIVHFYENTVPQMYRKLELLGNKDDTQDIYVDLRNKLGLMRLELLKAFRYCLATCVNTILENVESITEAEVKKHVDDYVGVLTECLSEKVFIHDYHSSYPVDHDLDAMSQVCPEMDFMKCDFLLEAVLACFDPPTQSKFKSLMTRKHHSLKMEEGAAAAASGEHAIIPIPKKRVTGIELDSLITEVKDILPHLGDGFVERCLEKFNYASETVINAILEDTLPEELRTLDFMLPRLPPDDVGVNDAANGVERLNVFDNDEFDIMTQDTVDTSRIHRGKRRGKHKDLKELLDDKTHRSELRDVYSKFGIVDTEGSMYDDDYDDTYDHLDVSVGEEGDLERRPFVVPRVLQTKEEEESSEDENAGVQREPGARNGRERDGPTRDVPPRDEFVSNPEEQRAKAEQNRQQKIYSRGRGWRRGPPPTKDRDVVGRPKGQGQDKQVVVNREYKTAHKSSRGNHNRRFGAQRKRQQGMMPS